MNLDRLRVVHAAKSAGHPLPPRRSGDETGLFSVETCLRLIWIDMDGAAGLAPLARHFGGEVLRGAAAYELLLEVACGLHSAIPGESEVFGQFRSAWKRFLETDPTAARRLEPLMQRLLEDVKEVRSRHLQGLGGATYGSLARLLLGEDLGKPTLLVGAGKMARAVASYLSGRPLYLWNRTPEHLDDLVSALGRSSCEPQQIHRLSADAGAELAAWSKAATIVICVPPDAQRDAERLAAWQSGSSRARIVHLGVLSTEETVWRAVPSLNTLQDLFDLRDARIEQRAGPLARARAACREKARLRGLGGSPSLAHGWEDLPFTLTA